MKFSCMSCGTKYSVPDGRVAHAGAGGLRVRCQRCRAIMVVSESQRFLFESGGKVSAEDSGAFMLREVEDEDTRPNRVNKRKGSSKSHKSHEPTTEGGLAMVSTDSDVEPASAPAALSASGVFRPLPGVNREVTGFFFPELEELKKGSKATSARLWYVAIGTRARGPFSATEVISLAEKGKVRDSTLVWRPGFGSWKRVKDGEAGSVEDLSWLRKIVQQRKVREREAQREAEQRLGIRPLGLVRTSQGPRPTMSGSGPGMPPPLPPPAFDEAFDGGGGEPSGVLPLSTLLEDGPQPFEWRADPSQVVGTKKARAGSAWLVTLGAAIVVGTVAALIVAAAGAPWVRLVASIAFG